MRLLRTLVLLAFVCVSAATARAQTATPPDPAQPAAAEPERADPDVRVDVLQPEFTLAALPTTLRMPDGKWAFRVTHRFTRSIGQGDVGDLFANAFGLDAGAATGLEVRYGLMPGVQLGVHRTSDRTVQFFGQQNILSERYGDEFGLDALVTLEGADNLTEQRSVALGAVLSKNYRRRAALYVEPLIVFNSNHLIDDIQTTEHTFMLGLGTRIRIGGATYGVAEITPRLAGYDAGEHQISVGFEHRTGGHLFQLNLSNGFGTTLGQIARGALDNESWYLGFNIARKFF